MKRADRKLMKELYTMMRTIPQATEAQLDIIGKRLQEIEKEMEG